MNNEREYDYVIIGGGSAGCVLANRLSANPANRVLLLDAGRHDRHLYSRIPAGQMAAYPRTDMNWLYPAEPDPSRDNRVDVWPAGKIIGGGSAINGMMYVRGHHSDYDHWAQLGNTGWSYDDVLPHFRSIEKSDIGDDKTRGKQGELSVQRVRIDNPLNDAFIKAAAETGIETNPDLNGESQEGAGYCQVSQNKGWRQSTARAFLQPARKRSNLQVELNAAVHRIGVEQGRARTAEYTQLGTEKQVCARKGVIVSAGAIASPKLLMLSGIGHEQELSEHGIEIVHALPGVGKNLQEHPVVGMTFHVKNARTLTSDLRNPLRSLQHGLDFLLHGRGALATPIAHAHALVRTRAGLNAPNAQIIFAALSYEITENGPRPYTKPAVDLGVGLCRTQSTGSVGLRSGQPSDHPVINYAALDCADDVQQLREAMRLARKIFQAPALAYYHLDERTPGASIESDDDLEAYIRANAGLMFHPCGTLKMGSDEMAVVDSRLRVRGIDRLWVADASIFPTIPAGNINATCIMVGEKAAAMILADT